MNCITRNLGVLIIVFCGAINSMYASETVNRCHAVFKKNLQQNLWMQIGEVKTDSTSYAGVDKVLVSVDTKNLILQKLLNFFGDSNGLSSSKYFTQLEIKADGSLKVILDSTVDKEQGSQLAEYLMSDVVLI